MPSTSSPSNTGVRTLSDEQLQELLRPGKEFESKVRAAVQQLPMGTVNVLLVSVKDYGLAAHALLRYYQSQKIPGIYVSVNRPYADLLKGLATPPENVHYIDAITALTGREAIDSAHVTYLDSPLALVELNLAISEQVKGLVSNQKYLALDSVSTLLVYNSPQAVEKFCHTIISKNRHEDVVCVLLMIESEEHKSVVETLAQFVDHVVSVR